MKCSLKLLVKRVLQVSFLDRDGSAPLVIILQKSILIQAKEHIHASAATKA